MRRRTPLAPQVDAVPVVIVRKDRWQGRKHKRKPSRPKPSRLAGQRKSQGLRRRKFNLGMLDFGIELIVGPARLVPMHIHRKFGQCDLDLFNPAEPPLGMTFHMKGLEPTIWIPKTPRRPREIATLAHELLHALRYTLEDEAGTPLGELTEEVWAHALGNLLTWALGWLWGRQGGIRTRRRKHA